jgi:predicted dehydrogenase
MAPAFRDSKYANAYAVASRDIEKAARFAMDHGFMEAYPDYDALINDPNIDAIYNPLPNSMHAEWSIKALQAGKHVLCEKPFASNAEEAKRMIAAARRNNRMIMEAFMYRLHPQTAKVERLIKSGIIGDLRIIRAAFGFGINTEAYNVRLVKELAGGCLMDVGCYCINAIRAFFGDEPSSVIGWAEYDRKLKVDMTFSGTLAYKDGRVGIFTSSFKSVLDCAVEIVGTKGRIFIPQPWKPHALLSSFTLEVAGKKEQIDVKNGGGIYQIEIDRFSRAVIENGPAPLPPEDGFRNMRVIDALYESSRTGTLVRVIKK